MGTPPSKMVEGSSSGASVAETMFPEADLLVGLHDHEKPEPESGWIVVLRGRHTLETHDDHARETDGEESQRSELRGNPE